MTHLSQINLNGEFSNKSLAEFEGHSYTIVIEAFHRTSKDHATALIEGFDASSVEDDSTAFFLKM